MSSCLSPSSSHAGGRGRGCLFVKKKQLTFCISTQATHTSPQLHVQFSSVKSLDHLDCQGDMREDSATTFHGTICPHVPKHQSAPQCTQNNKLSKPRSLWCHHWDPCYKDWTACRWRQRMTRGQPLRWIPPCAGWSLCLDWCLVSPVKTRHQKWKGLHNVVWCQQNID